MQQLTLIKRAMRMAAKRGVDPYNSAVQQGRCFRTVFALQTRGRSEADANRSIYDSQGMLTQRAMEDMGWF